jgi:hypothetical protein
MASDAAPPPLLHHPFLLPICDCGGPMNLASVQPHPDLPDHELKTFRCSSCGSQQAFNGRRRTEIGTD